MARDVLKQRRTDDTNGLQINADGECAFTGRVTGRMQILITILSGETHGY